MLDGPVSNVKLFRIPLTQPHHSSVRRRVCRSEKLWQADFHPSVERERASLEWLEGLRWERAEWKQMSEMLAAKCACVWLRVCVSACVFGSRTVITGPRLILKCQSPTAVRSSFTTLISFPSVLTIISLSIILTDRGLKGKWRCSGMQGCLRNRKSPPLESQTTPSSSQVCTYYLMEGQKPL